MAKFKGEQRHLKALFYQIRGESVGVALVSPDGQKIAAVSEPYTLGLHEGTGVYDVTGDGWPEIVMVAGVGAKTLACVVYEYDRGQLREIFRTSGYSIKATKLRGRPVIAVNLQYGTLSDLYAWQNGSFENVNELFPEYYGPEIDQQKRILDAPQGLPVYVILDACKLGARGLVYGKNYEDAKQLCLKALEVARSAPGLIASQIGAGPEALAREREQAGDEIRAMLDRLAEAQKKGMPHVLD